MGAKKDREYLKSNLSDILERSCRDIECEDFINSISEKDMNITCRYLGIDGEEKITQAALAKEYGNTPMLIMQSIDRVERKVNHFVNSGYCPFCSLSARAQSVICNHFSDKRHEAKTILTKDKDLPYITFEDIASLTEEQILKTMNCGPNTLEEIRIFLHKYGYKFANEK